MILAGIPGIAGANPPVTETSVSGFIARAPAAIVSCRSARGGGRLLTDIATATGLVATTGTVTTGGEPMAITRQSIIQPQVAAQQAAQPAGAVGTPIQLPRRSRSRSRSRSLRRVCLPPANRPSNVGREGITLSIPIDESVVVKKTEIGIRQD